MLKIAKSISFKLLLKQLFLWKKIICIKKVKQVFLNYSLGSSLKLKITSFKITVWKSTQNRFQIKGKKRAIIVKFFNFKDKDAVLNQYRQKQLWKVNIYVNEDYTERTEDLRNYLNKQKRFGSRENLQRLCIRNL